MSIIISASPPLQPPLCLDLWDDLASISSGNAAEDELSIILPASKSQETAEEHVGSLAVDLCWKCPQGYGQDFIMYLGWCILHD